MTVEKELLSATVMPAPLASEASERDQAGTQSTSPLALRCACARQCGAVPGFRAFGPRRALRRRPARDDVGERCGV